ncbi:Aldo/keto reductase [Chlamydoabsidia padenii]|nr:Aldo/keto reductase [Chlamydoabsidia padenii]
MKLLSVASKVKLSDSSTIPCIGFGVYECGIGKETQQAVRWALEAGYRHIDTATVYHNEQDVGLALKNSDIPREDIFVTTKLHQTDQGYETTLTALEKSLAKLKMDYVDLYLIHSPLRGKKLRLESWKALEELKRSGKAKHIGVSNYGVHHLQELLDHCQIKPEVNQVEITPYLQRNDIAKFCQQNNILVEAYSPLTRGEKLQEKSLLALAEKHKKSTAQILIRWSLQKGYVPLPKSVTKSRIIGNADVFDFTLSDEDMATLDKLDEYYVTEWDPTVCD